MESTKTTKATKAKHTAPVAKDFSLGDRKALSSQGIAIVGSTWLPGPGGDFANGERGYMLDDNGTSRIRTYSQVRTLAGAL